MRILILGGTGFIGPNEVEYALERGHTVTMFSRGNEPNPWPGRVEELVGNRDTGDLKALEGREWDVCIDNPAMVPSWVRDIGKVLGGKVGQYIFISTVAVYAERDKAADETAPLIGYDGGDPMAETMETLYAGKLANYGPLKVICEQEAERWFPGKTTIIRPGFIVGRGDKTDRFTYWPVRLSEDREVLASGPRDPVQIIDVRDLGEWAVRMAEQRTFGIFNACGPGKLLAMGDMLAGIRQAIGSDAEVTWVSTAFLEAEGVSPFGGLPIWFPGEGALAGFALRDISRAVGAGLTFRTLSDTAADTLAWFRSLPADRQAAFRAGPAPERQAELLAKWRTAADTRA